MVENEFSHRLSPEPTAVLSRHSFGAKADGAVSSAVAVHAASRRWLSFLRRRHSRVWLL
jgi:hypothetical protein